MKKNLLITLVAILVLAGGVYYVEENNASKTVSDTATTTDRTASSTTMDAIGVTDEGKEIPVKVTVNPTVSITQADNNTNVRIKQGSTVVLALGEDIWTLSLKPEGILERMKNIAAIRGVQGIYTAKGTGTVAITGEGRPNCEGKEMCAQYIVSFAVNIIVEK
jgi:hypothetical protein